MVRHSKAGYSSYCYRNKICHAHDDLRESDWPRGRSPPFDVIFARVFGVFNQASGLTGIPPPQVVPRWRGGLRVLHLYHQINVMVENILKLKINNAGNNNSSSCKADCGSE